MIDLPNSRIIVAAGAILAILVGCVGVQKIQKAWLTADLERTQGNVKVLTFANESFAASVANQNSAIHRMQEEAAARKQAADAAVAKAKESAAVYERTAMDLMGRTVTGDECAATKQLLDEVIR